MFRSTLRTHLPALALGSLVACSDPAGPGSMPDAFETVVVATTLRSVDAPDITTAFPLPQLAADIEMLVPASARGKFGPLVPQALFNQIGEPLDPRGAAVGSATAPVSGLRLVAMRLDPCFDGLATACIPQIRLVFQGVDAAPTQVEAADGAIHAFFEVPKDELLVAVKQILTLKEASGGYAAGPLGVHPALASQGLRGAYMKGLRNIVLEHCGESRLSRMTFFVRTNSRQSEWKFGMLNKSGAGFVRGKIATIAGNEQTIGAGLSLAPSQLAGSIKDITTHPDNLSVLINTVAAGSAAPAARTLAYDAALRIENPSIHSPETIDCVSCHVATPIRRSAEPVFAFRPAGNPNAFKAGAFSAAAFPAKVNLENLHALSYLKTELGITQRTANETDVAVEKFNAQLQ